MDPRLKDFADEGAIDRILGDDRLFAVLLQRRNAGRYATAREIVLAEQRATPYIQLGFKTQPTRTKKRGAYFDVGALHVEMPRGLGRHFLFMGCSMRFLGSEAMLTALHELNCLGFGHRFYVSRKDQDRLKKEVCADLRRTGSVKPEDVKTVTKERVSRLNILRSVELFKRVHARGAHPVMAVAPGSGGLLHALALFNHGCRRFGIDMAQGANEMALALSREIRALGEDIFIVSGSVDDVETAEKAVEAGADALRIGVGCGQACTTRIVAGAGLTQAVAIAEIAEWAEGNNLLARQRKDGTGIVLIADGGRERFAFTAFALALGADVIMFGTSSAHAKEADVRRVIRYDRQEGLGVYLEIYGMSSDLIIDETHENGDEKPMAEGEVFYRKTRLFSGGRPSIHSMARKWSKGLGSSLSYAGIPVTPDALEHFRHAPIFFLKSPGAEREDMATGKFSR